MRELDIAKLDKVRGGVGETCEPDQGGASELICVPIPDTGGACYADTNYSHIDRGETWTGGTW